MATKATKLSAAQIDEAEGYCTMAASQILEDRGLPFVRRRFARHAKRRDVAAKMYADFLAAGGKLGDWESFIQYILDHADQIIAMISKLIALFTTMLLVAVTVVLQLLAIAA